MSSICAFIVALTLFLGLPISVVWLIIRLIKKKSLKPLIISICLCLGFVIVLSIVGATAWSKTDDYQEYLAAEQERKIQTEKLQTVEESKEQTEIAQRKKEQGEQERTTQEETKKDPEEKKRAEKPESQQEAASVPEKQSKQETDTLKEDSGLKQTQDAEHTQEIGDPASTTVPEQTQPELDVNSLSEEDYKASCAELWHDDIFFSEDDLEGKLVKLDLFVEEERFYDANTVLNNYTVSDFLKKYDARRTFFFCGVNRRDEIASYMGGQVNLYISNDYDLSINAGDHLTFYGEIISYSTMTWDGYNSCYLMPKYIENNG